MLQWIYKLNNRKKTVAKSTMFFVAVFLLFIIFVPIEASAQGATGNFGLDTVGQDVVLGAQDIRVTIAKIIRAVLSLLGIIALGLILYAGFTIMTSAGNAERVATGKRILINTSIGLAIILSSLGITQFIISRLIGATGAGGGPGISGSPPARQSFSGSGSLGNILRDHYPFRGQQDVARNTKISVTFNEPIDPASLINDSNNNGTYGDCINTSDPAFDWTSNYCDQLINSSVEIFKSSDSGTLLPSAALAIYEGAGNEAFTFTFRPLQMLGSDTEDINYTVKLTNNISKLNGSGAFDNDRDGMYFWDFTTGVNFDYDPPHIISVNPIRGSNVSRNSVVQINFNEAVDPSVTQGLAGPTSAFYHIIFGDQSVTGEWKITNGYRTVEFVSDQACGENSCGQPMYCLPPAAHSILIRTANLISASSFEALPFSGVLDMSSNALDGDNDGLPDGKPAMPGNFKVIGGGEDQADNYLWNFTVQDEIDRTAPYIVQVEPGLDQEDLPPNSPHIITFSKPMWMGTLSGIKLIERFYIPSNNIDVSPLWYHSRGEVNSNNQTVVNTSHREFGPNGEDAYYFTSIPSEVKSLNQNCVYPGRGPYSASRSVGASPLCSCTEDVNGNLSCDQNCVNVNFAPTTDTGCLQTVSPGNLLKSNIAECITTLEGLSPTL